MMSNHIYTVKKWTHSPWTSPTLDLTPFLQLFQGWGCSDGPSPCGADNLVGSGGWSVKHTFTVNSEYSSGEMQGSMRILGRSTGQPRNQVQELNGGKEAS